MSTNTPSPSQSDSENPHLTHIDRAPYELGYLLRGLPADFASFKPASATAVLMADAAATHAGNATDTLLSGLEALGNILFVAGANEENEIDKGDIASLGALIAHLAIECQFMQETAHDLRWILAEQKKNFGSPNDKNNR
jgi:hypothetical protein